MSAHPSRPSAFHHVLAMIVTTVVSLFTCILNGSDYEIVESDRYGSNDLWSDNETGERTLRSRPTCTRSLSFITVEWAPALVAAAEAWHTQWSCCLNNHSNNKKPEDIEPQRKVITAVPVNFIVTKQNVALPLQVASL